MKALYGGGGASSEPHACWLRAPPPHPLRLLAMTKVIAGTSRKYINIGLSLRSRFIPMIGGGMSVDLGDTANFGQLFMAGEAARGLAGDRAGWVVLTIGNRRLPQA